MSAPGWQYDERRREHTLAAGVFVARVTASRSVTACSLVVRVAHEDSPRGSSATELTLVGWCDEVDDVEQHKARLEAEILRITREAREALGGAK